MGRRADDGAGEADAAATAPISDDNLTTEDDVTDWLAESAEDQPTPWSGRIFLAATFTLWLILAGGLGGLIGWLLMNGPDTIAEREAARPRMSVAITLPGAKAANDSDVTTMAPQDDGAISMAAVDGQAATGGGKGGDLAGVEADLYEDGLHGFLPRIAADGRKPWQVYRRPTKTDKRPRIALLFTDMGLSQANSAAAVRDLPSEVSLSFSALAKGLENQVAAARRDGHEVFLDLPMEPSDYPRSDPGPYTLLTSASLVENLDRLEWTLAQATGYVGVVTKMGGRFTADNESMMPVLEALKKRGLMFIDARASSRSLAIELATTLALPRAYGNAVIDAVPARADIERRLAALENRARIDGVAVGLARNYPVTLAVVKAWLAGVAQRNYQLVPVSAVADGQRGR